MLCETLCGTLYYAGRYARRYAGRYGGRYAGRFVGHFAERAMRGTIPIPILNIHLEFKLYFLFKVYNIERAISKIISALIVF
jgi:hypothetical protein